MTDDTSLRILYGESQEILEVDQDEQEDRSVNALNSYDTYIFTESIGTPEFKTNYFLFINEIKLYDIRDLKDVCFRVLDKVEEVYEFNFSENPNFNILEERMYLFDFIKFLEFDNVDFLSDLYNNLNITLIGFDVDDYIDKNSKKILFTIQSMNQIYTYNPFILDFILNYNKSTFMKWIKKQTRINKIEIETNIRIKKGE